MNTYLNAFLYLEWHFSTEFCVSKVLPWINFLILNCPKREISKIHKSSTKIAFVCCLNTGLLDLFSFALTIHLRFPSTEEKSPGISFTNIRQYRRSCISKWINHRCLWIRDSDVKSGGFFPTKRCEWKSKRHKSVANASYSFALENIYNELEQWNYFVFPVLHVFIFRHLNKTRSKSKSHFSQNLRWSSFDANEICT